jgi:hypothetical protein
LTNQAVTSQNYTITIGAGGTGGFNDSNNGGSTSALGTTSIGGGHGADSGASATGGANGGGATGAISTLYVYTTSTTVVSTITINIEETDGTTKSVTNAVRYLKGLSLHTAGSTGNHYKVTNVVAPTTLASGSVATEVTFNTTDAFGNVLETPAIATALTDSTGTLTDEGVATWDSVRKVHVAKVASTTNNPFVLTIDINGTAADAPDNLGLGASSTTFAAVVNNAGVAAQITALTAQLAALQIIKDRKVSKLKYNTLARKWNKAFPSQKVWVKP